MEQPRVDIPVFKVRNEKTKKVKTLHRNHLVPVNYKEDLDEDVAVNEVPEETSAQKEDDVQVEGPSDGKRDEEVKVAKDKEKGVDTREESDSDEELGYFYVAPTYKNGDARLPQIKKSEETVEVVEDDGRKSATDEHRVVIEIRPDVEESGEIPPQRSDVETVQDGQEQNTGDARQDSQEENNADYRQVEVQTIEARVDTDVRLETREQDVSTVEPQVDLREETRRKVVDDDRRHRNRDKIEDRLEAVDVRPTETEENRDDEDAPRRSSRQRRMPARYDAYQMNQMIPRPQDSRLQALTELVESGILNNIDTMIAQKILDSVWK
ncbi:uncharacterized protein LOC128235802 [Mya arenaria]|uniref:uncharacterized protein LOC128235802 n=1 Tax=Mya arenaria TaxID=6604 RepID=UPI0022E23792|nr:uncharacterized protein LOC128235802 [Mya arenaria]